MVISPNSSSTVFLIISVPNIEIWDDVSHISYISTHKWHASQWRASKSSSIMPFSSVTFRPVFTKRLARIDLHPPAPPTGSSQLPLSDRAQHPSFLEYCQYWPRRVPGTSGTKQNSHRQREEVRKVSPCFAQKLQGCSFTIRKKISSHHNLWCYGGINYHRTYKPS